ncbi:MAG: 2-oxo acid dehydrogenase subunit E2 [Thermoanaerobaculales bacterium]
MPLTINLPELGDDVDSVDVVAVLVAVGARIEAEQGLIEVETEKASVEVPSTAGGTVAEVHIAVGDVLRAGAPIVTIEPEEQESGGEEEEREEKGEEAKKVNEEEAESIVSVADPQPTQPPAPVPPAPPSELTKTAAVPAAPSVRRFAREIGVDITRVAGSGAGGRISIEDVKGHANRLLAGSAQEAPGSSIAALPDLERWGPVRREAMSKVRRLTAENLARAWATAPQVTNHERVDITDLEEFRQAAKGRVEAAGGKLTMTAIIAKVVATALRDFPTLNACVDMARREIVFRETIHIGVAVDTERGLLVPVIRDADRKNLTDISRELDDLAIRARTRKLKPDEMRGGTFSISNLGGIGGTGFSPIVNWPEVAILGVSRGRIEPEWHEGAFRPRLILPLSLSYDHRSVDGADAARFLRRVADTLEQPMLLALEG